MLLALAWKSALCAGIVLTLIQLLQKRSAAERSVVAAAGLCALALLPVSMALLPAYSVQAPASVSAVIADLRVSGHTPPASALSEAAHGANGTVPWEAIARYVYGLPVALLLMGLLVGVARLWRVRNRAEVIEDYSWLSALAAAQKRLGIKHGVALLASDELASPVSWGAARPIIIVDRAATSTPTRAEIIIAHELAHVARLDWVSLLLGRVAVCLFWFNPLVWLLARRSHQLCEEAADDAVLRAKIGCIEYADVLVNAVRHANTAYLPANGVVPSRSSLAQRVAHVLDATRPRSAARRGWIAATLVMALGINVAVASAEPILRQRFVPAYRVGVGELSAAKLEQLQSTQAKALAKALRSKSWEARRAPGDTRFQEAAAVTPLIDALGDDSPAVRRIALWGLSEMGAFARPRAEKPVLLLLEDRSPDIRGLAARTLGDFGAAATAGSISPLLQDEEVTVRREAAHALGDLQNPSTRPVLEAALHDPDPQVRAKAVWALRQIVEAEHILKRDTSG